MRGASNHHNALGVTIQPQQWLAPPTGYIKINVDAGIYKNGAFVGIVARDNNANVQGVCVFACTTNNPTEAEAFAVFAGIRKAVAKWWSNVILESDCKAVVDEWNENQGKLEWEAHVHIDNSFSF